LKASPKKLRRVDEVDEVAGATIPKAKVVSMLAASTDKTKIATAEVRERDVMVMVIQQKIKVRELDSE
jgi:hypothetical protein